LDPKRSGKETKLFYAPGTGTPEPGGLTTLEAQRLIRDLGGLDFVGADLVEALVLIAPLHRQSEVVRPRMSVDPSGTSRAVAVEAV